MVEKGQIIKIVIADDHTIFRDGLKNLFANQPEFRVVGEAGDGYAALELVRRVQPDVLLLDLQMPRLSGMEVLRSLSEEKSSVRTVLLSGVVEGEQISAAFELGVRGVVLKDSATSMLFKSIHTIMAGQYWIGRQAVSNLIQTLKNHRESTQKSKPKNFGLTSREMEVIKSVVSGYSNKEIARQLAISEQTVKHHITNIFDKMGVYNRLELTLFAFHHGIVEK